MVRIIANISLYVILLLSQGLLFGCSAIVHQSRFAPRLDDYKTSGYKAESKGVEADAVNIPASAKEDEDYISGAKRAPRALLSGDKPELVLTSAEYQIAIEASLKSERLLTIGPCIIIPLPVIPVLLFKDDVNGNLQLYGNITSLNGQKFTLNKISATAGTNKFDDLKFITRKTTYGYIEEFPSTEDRDRKRLLKQQKTVFRVIAPVSIQEVTSFDVNIYLTEGNGNKVALPQVHFYSSSGVVWYVCAM